VDDLDAMRQAVAIAATARRVTAPRPWVGCVLVRDGVVVGAGATESVPGRHAEAVALADAGDRARGATAVVTLEPHAFVSNTPPCTDALIAAGVARVVVGVEDPDARVAGRGIAQLRAAGIPVEVGIGAAEVTEQLRPYLHQRRTGRAYCVVKSAMSIDGRTAAADGTSQWITSEVARADAHELRADSQAVIIGSGTALADAPSLTARTEPRPAHQPVRVVLDGRGRVPAGGPLADSTLAPTLVVTTAHAPREYTKRWLAAGADVEEVGPGRDGTGVDLRAVLKLLGARGVIQALVEGGATVHGSLARGGLVDRLVTYVGGVTLGAAGVPMLAGAGPTSLSGASRWRLVAAASFGGDARLEWEPV